MWTQLKVGNREFLLLFLGILVGASLSISRQLDAQAPQPTSAQGCGEWVMQTRQGPAEKNFNAFVLNTRTGEVVFLKDENKFLVKVK